MPQLTKWKSFKVNLSKRRLKSSHCLQDWVSWLLNIKWCKKSVKSMRSGWTKKKRWSRKWRHGTEISANKFKILNQRKMSLNADSRDRSKSCWSSKGICHLTNKRIQVTYLLGVLVRLMLILIKVWIRHLVHRTKRIIIMILMKSRLRT